jgi:hypothetical protein
MVLLGKEYSDTSYKPGSIRVDRANEEVTVNKSLKFLYHYEKYSIMYEAGLNSGWWPIVSIVLVLFSIINFLKSKSFVYFFISIIGFTIFGNFSIIAFAEYSIPRYTYVYEFLYVLIPILFVAEKVRLEGNKVQN